MRKLISTKLLVLGFFVASILSIGGLAAAGLPYSPLANFGVFDDPYGPYGRPRVWIEPQAPDQVLPGEQIYIDVWSSAMDGAEPVGWQYDLDYDPNILTFLDAEPLLPSIVAQDLSEPCISAYNDNGGYVSTAIACQFPAPFHEVPLARYWFEVEPHLPVGLFGRVDVRDTFVGSFGHPPREIESQGHSDWFVVGGGVCGDQNDDGLVNILDAIVDMQIIVGITEPTARQLVLSDLDDDGDITVVDVIILLQYIVGWVDHLDCGVPPFAAECPTAPFIDGPGPHVTSLDWAMHPDNSLIFDFNVDLSETGTVWTEYWPVDGSTGPLQTALSGPAQSLDYQVMRLRADTTYCFWVSATHGALTLDSSGLNPPPITDMVAGSFHTGPLPDGLADAEFIPVVGRPTYDMTVLEHNASDFHGFVAIDQNTDVVWYYEQDTGVWGSLAQKPNMNILMMDGSDNRLAEIGPDGSLLNQVSDTMNGEVCQRGRWHHEMLLLSDNRALVLGSEIRPVQFDVSLPSGQIVVVDESLGAEYLASVNSNDIIRNQTGDTIELWDIDAGIVSRIFSEFDVLDPTIDRTDASNATSGVFWRGCAGDVDSEDWTHSNSLDVMNDGNILISMRHLNQLIAIDPVNGQLAWRLGGPRSDFVFPNPSDQFYGQHSARQLPNGNILLLDNGNFRPVGEGGQYTRALELELDFVNMAATKVWEYRHAPDIYAACCSNVHRLDNGNTVLVFGADFATNECCRGFTIVETDFAGNTVSEIQVSAPGKAIQYRVYPFDTINGESKVPPQ